MEKQKKEPPTAATVTVRNEAFLPNLYDNFNTVVRLFIKLKWLKRPCPNQFTT